MKKNVFFALASGAMITALTACTNLPKDTTPPVIDEDTFLPADCSDYYLGDTLDVHFCCSDDTELGNYNIEIHNNFDHHTHGTSASDCDSETPHDEDAHHDHEDGEEAWVYNQTFALPRSCQKDTVQVAIPVPADAMEGDYHFMLRLTDRAGWQTIKAVAIHLHEPQQ